MEYNFRGKHDSTKNNYVKKDVVSYQTNTSSPITFHVCLTDHNTPQIPSQIGDTQFWGLLNTSSNFPNSIDSFLYRANVQVTDKADINRINELQKKPSLSVDEQNELNALMTKHRNKFFLAEDINALQQSVSNMQLFFKDNIDAKLQDYNNQITQNKDDALTAIEKKKENIIEYMDGATAGQIRNDMGVMGELTTQAKDSLVNAINEVNAKEVDLTPIENSIGDKALLETENKENLVNAINEINSKPSIYIGTEAPTKGEFWLDGNEKLNYKNSIGTWKGVAPSQVEFDSLQQISNQHIEDKNIHIQPHYTIYKTNDLKQFDKNGTYRVQVNNEDPVHDFPFSSVFDYMMFGYLEVKNYEYSGVNAGKFAITQILREANGVVEYRRFKDNLNQWSNWQLHGVIVNHGYYNIWVDSVNGTDADGFGKSSGTGAFKTLLYALNSIPTNLIGGQITINLASGSYPAFIYNPQSNNFIKSKIIIRGDSTQKSIASGSWEIFNIKNLTVQNINFTNQGVFRESDSVLFENISGTGGVYISNSRYVKISNSVLSNNVSGTAIQVADCTDVLLSNVSGSGNKVGIDCLTSTVRKLSNSTITGTTPQTISYAGQILT